MLRSLFPRAYCRFLSLPLLGCVADGFDDWLAANGYTRVSRQNSIRMLPHVEAELRRRQVKELANLAQPVLRNCWRTLRKNRPFSARAVRTLDRYLAANGLIADDQPATGTSTASELANEYANYLREVRGFAASTVANHRYTVQCFLQHLDGAEIALNKIRVAQIESYIIQAGKRLSRSSLQHDISALRSFLRFQAIEDRVPSGLASQIDTPRLYQLEKLPRALPWETVRNLLRSVDRTSAMGLRDYAMLLLIATYGLRVSEVVAITLDDIRWRQGSLRIRQSKTSSPLGLPLTNERFHGAGKASEANATPSAVSPDLSENARSHRSVETYGDQGSFFTLGSEQWPQDSLPGRTLSAPLVGGSSPEERNIPQDHRRCPRASFRSEHVDVSTTGHRGLA